MAEEKEGNSDSDKFFVSVMPEGDLQLLIPDSYYASSLPEAKFATAVLEDSEPKSSQDMRKSTGNLDIPYTKVKILSRYLASSSSGSCHDYCKFGTQHAAETKPSRPLFGRMPEAERQHVRRVTFSAAGNMQNVMSRRLSLSPMRGTIRADQGDIRKPEVKSRLGIGKMASPQDKEAVSPALKKIARQPNTSSSSAKQFRNVLPVTKETVVEKPARTKKQGEESTSSVSSFRSNGSSRKGEATRSTSSSSLKPLRHAEGEPSASRRPSRPCTPSLASTRPAAGAVFKHNGMNKAADPRGVARSRAGNGGGTSTLGKASPVRKPTFRGGKRVELESETPSSRRLAARRKSPGCSSQDGKPASQLGSLKPTETQQTEDDRAQSEHEHEKVALRHPDGKEKGAVNLLNNVIEATASKLAEENHSKVRALVGAFESVISLQDRNQASL